MAKTAFVDIVAIALCFLAAAFGIALATYSPQDPTLVEDVNHFLAEQDSSVPGFVKDLGELVGVGDDPAPLSNKFGIAGAYMVGDLVEALGLGAWGVPALLLLLGLPVFFKSAAHWTRGLGIILLALCASAFFSAPSLQASPTFGGIAGGGYVGARLADAVLANAGAVGGQVVWLFVLACSLRLISGVQASRLVHALAGRRKPRTHARTAVRETRKSAPASRPGKEAPSGRKDAEAVPSEAPPEDVLRILPLEKDRYRLPAAGLIGKLDAKQSPIDVPDQSVRILDCLESFGVRGEIVDVVSGPTVTIYQYNLEKGIKSSKFKELRDEISRAVGAECRLDDSPEKGFFGVEVPNPDRGKVGLGRLLQSPEFRDADMTLPVALGRDLYGSPVVFDLARQPHLLVGGATGQGKSMCLNAIVASLLVRFEPSELRFLFMDPKLVELSQFKGLPHLALPIVTEPSEACRVLEWCVDEVDRRYRLLDKAGVRNLADYNARQRDEKLPYLVVVVDEYADLHDVDPGVDSHIRRIAQKARAAGVHLILATQRPSVDVITGVIKSNLPARIALKTATSPDSRTILDGVGAEKLLGEGDMLFRHVSDTKARRCQGAFVDDKGLRGIVDHWKKQ